MISVRCKRDSVWFQFRNKTPRTYRPTDSQVSILHLSIIMTSEETYKDGAGIFIVMTFVCRQYNVTRNESFESNSNLCGLTSWLQLVAY